jgi:hypothetical protein
MEKFSCCIPFGSCAKIGMGHRPHAPPIQIKEATHSLMLFENEQNGIVSYEAYIMSWRLSSEYYWEGVETDETWCQTGLLMVERSKITVMHDSHLALIESKNVRSTIAYPLSNHV